MSNQPVAIERDPFSAVLLSVLVHPLLTGLWIGQSDRFYKLYLVRCFSRAFELRIKQRAQF